MLSQKSVFHGSKNFQLSLLDYILHNELIVYWCLISKLYMLHLHVIQVQVFTLPQKDLSSIALDNEILCNYKVYWSNYPSQKVLRGENIATSPHKILTAPTVPINHCFTPQTNRNRCKTVFYYPMLRYSKGKRLL